jgi:hypothetical protein
VVSLWCRRGYVHCRGYRNDCVGFMRMRMRIATTLAIAKDEDCRYRRTHDRSPAGRVEYPRLTGIDGGGR